MIQATLTNIHTATAKLIDLMTDVNIGNTVDWLPHFDVIDAGLTTLRKSSIDSPIAPALYRVCDRATPERVEVLRRWFEASDRHDLTAVWMESDTAMAVLTIISCATIYAMNTIALLN